MAARLSNILLTFFFIAALAVFTGGIWLAHEVKKAGPLAQEKLVYIEPGTSVRGMAKKLIAENVIGDHIPFLILARWGGREESLKAGEYQFLPGINVASVIALLQSGKTYQHKITIPEGLMTVEITLLLEGDPALTGKISSVPKEGSLLPETYAFSRGDTRDSVIHRMETAMKDELKSLWEKRAENLPLKTPGEAVVLASVVEKETGLAKERPRVAGVFINRLNKGIPLQSDPTVIYALTMGKAKLERSLIYNDLKTLSPYNTYVMQGLPPTPIANPGRASLAAVLNPEKNDYIYFVADGTGGHVFAKTLQEHNRNVARWRKIEKNQ